jgi:hypothetical protein
MNLHIGQLVRAKRDWKGVLVRDQIYRVVRKTDHPYSGDTYGIDVTTLHGEPVKMSGWGDGGNNWTATMFEPLSHDRQ